MLIFSKINIAHKNIYYHNILCNNYQPVNPLGAQTPVKITSHLKAWWHQNLLWPHSLFFFSPSSWTLSTILYNQLTLFIFIYTMRARYRKAGLYSLIYICLPINFITDIRILSRWAFRNSQHDDAPLVKWETEIGHNCENRMTVKIHLESNRRKGKNHKNLTNGNETLISLTLFSPTQHSRLKVQNHVSPYWRKFN